MKGLCRFTYEEVMGRMRDRVKKMSAKNPDTMAKL
jgi:hypothetical protein